MPGQCEVLVQAFCSSSNSSLAAPEEVGAHRLARSSSPFHGFHPQGRGAAAPQKCSSSCLEVARPTHRGGEGGGGAGESENSDSLGDHCGIVGSGTCTSFPILYPFFSKKVVRNVNFCVPPATFFAYTVIGIGGRQNLPYRVHVDLPEARSGPVGKKSAFSSQQKSGALCIVTNTVRVGRAIETFW